MLDVCISHAANDVFFDEDDRQYIDLFIAHGTAWLGHCNPGVTVALMEQMTKIWMTGVLETPIRAEARDLINSFFPPSHQVVALYSTGMEAAEFALRLARVATGRPDVVGFERGMHGKSLATAHLCWDNHDGVQVTGFQRLPFLPTCSEHDILPRLKEVLARETVSAVFIEPVQGTGGGHRASDDFYRRLYDLCHAYGTLLVFDEILTGFHRTGPAFFYSDLGFVPDVILLGKGLGNGFPVSAVVADKRYPVQKQMLPGSTFAGNPLAAAAIVGTLRQVRAPDFRARVDRIDQLIQTSLAPLEKVGLTLRGRGAMWIVELPPELNGEAIQASVLRHGVAVGCAGRCLRILPPATIEEDNLRTACTALVRVLREACHG